MPALHADAHAARVRHQGDGLTPLDGLGAEQHLVGDDRSACDRPTGGQAHRRRWIIHIAGGSVDMSRCSVCKSFTVNTLPATMACAAKVT